MQPLGPRDTVLVAFCVILVALATLASRAPGADTAPASLGAGFTVPWAAPPTGPEPAPEPPAAAEPPPAEESAPPSLDAVVAAEVAGRPACVLVRRDGRDLLAHEADRSLIPASTQKVLVASAALGLLGGDHRFRTHVRALPMPANGAVDHLWLVGGGDPMLATPEYAGYLPTNLRWRDHETTSLAGLADAVAAAGIRHVRGHVYGDDSRHDAVRALPSWKPRHLEAGIISPLSALTVNGGWAKYTPPRAPLAHPAVDAASELVRLLGERGVAVDGGPAHGIAPAEAPAVGEVHSAPLVSIARALLRASDNNATEMLVREIGLHHAGVASTEAGTRAVREILGRAGVDVAGIGLVDGSGLSQGNRVTCRALAQTLELRPAGLDPSELLAVAGRNGTLWRRLQGTPHEGTLSAKTGYIGGVTGLTGRLGDGRTTFAILQNQTPSLLEGRSAEERILEHLRTRLPG